MLSRYFLCCLFFVSISSADASSTWIDAEVSTLKSFTSQIEHFVHLNSKHTNPSSCSNAEILVLLRDDSNNWQMVHSNILAGMLAGKRIKFRVNGCQGTYAKIDGIELYN